MLQSSADHGISVDVRRMLPDPKAPTWVLRNHPDHGLLEFRASAAVDLELDVQHAPLPDDHSHANILGLAPLPRKAQARVRKELAMASAWVRQPPDAGALADANA